VYVAGSFAGVRGGAEGVHGYQLPAGRQHAGQDDIREGEGERDDGPEEKYVMV